MAVNQNLLLTCSFKLNALGKLVIPSVGAHVGFPEHVSILCSPHSTVAVFLCA